MLVSSVPLSETHMAGRPRVAMTASSSRATRRPGSEVSATRQRHSRVKSSTTAKIRKRRPSVEQRLTEVQAPALVRPLRDRHRGPGAERPLAPATPTHLEPLLAIEPAELLVVHGRLRDGAGYADAGSRTAGGWRPTPAAGRGSHYRPAGGCDSGSSPIRSDR